MSKSERLLHLITLLRSRRTATTAQTLAEKLQVSERTVYRDIQSLIAAGAMIEGEAGIGYLLRSESSLSPLMFTEKEVEALMLGIRLVQGWSDDEIVGHSNTAMQKIRSVLPQALLHKLEDKNTKYLVPPIYREERSKFSELIRQGIDQLKGLNLSYEDEKKQKTQRLVFPLGLVFWGSTWTLIAWCTKRDDYRMFRLDRIVKATLSNTGFQPDDNMNLKDYISRYSDNTDVSFW